MRAKGAFLVILMLATYLMPNPESDFKQFAPALAILVGLFALNFNSFKADLTAHTKEPWAIVMQSSGKILGIVMLFMMASTVFYHLPLFIAGCAHRMITLKMVAIAICMNMKWVSAQLMFCVTARTLLLIFMPNRLNLLIRSFSLLTSGPSHAKARMYVKDKQYALLPRGLNQVWQFSHDEMVMIGRNSKTEEVIGVIGQNGFLDNLESVTEEDRFETVPFMIGESFLETTSHLYQVNFADREMLVKHQPDAGEEYIGRLQINEDYIVIVSDKKSYLFDKVAFIDEFEAAEAEYVVEHPTRARSNGMGSDIPFS